MFFNPKVMTPIEITIMENYIKLKVREIANSLNMFKDHEDHIVKAYIDNN